MTHFDDLTPHSYTAGIEEDVLNVGWLGEGEPFTIGSTSQQFRTALKQLCQKPILLHRGAHRCEFCSGISRAAGNGQVRVRSHAGIWYSAPTLILHYVAEHDYRPPDGFVDAVLDPLEIETEENGDAVLRGRDAT